MSGADGLIGSIVRSIIPSQRSLTPIVNDKKPIFDTDLQ